MELSNGPSINGKLIRDPSETIRSGICRNLPGASASLLSTALLMKFSPDLIVPLSGTARTKIFEKLAFPVGKTSGV
jgi:hypothetical protein